MHAVPSERRAPLIVAARECDMPGVLIPRPELHLVARFGACGELDVHAVGVRETVHRKLMRGGQRSVLARVPLGAHEAVFGVPASALAGRHVAIDVLWGDVVAQRLLDRLAHARSASDAAVLLEDAVAERVRRAGRVRRLTDVHTELALAAAHELTRTSVHTVAHDLGVSERHLRRVFRESLGVGPKTFAKLARFRAAVHAARASTRASWASIALAAGYYDQAHLIAEFRAIAGVTPQCLLGELHTSTSVV